MLTSRGYWFVFISLLLLGTGIRIHNTTLGVMGMTLLVWFCWEWLVFALRVHGLVRHLAVGREVRDERGPVEGLWAGQTFRVLVQLRLQGDWSLPYVKISERVPYGVDKVRGTTERDGSVARGRPLELTYRLHCPNPGQVRFEGLGVQLADLQGFFYHATFISSPRIFRVLPPLADARGRIPSVKRYNMLPLLGVHRHRRPGSGSELLDLRDYIPGDPPKTIAWKASARRDRLMTKEFESEVPVRCTLFVDTSNSVRVGPPGRNALTRLIEISASVAQASAGARDLTGLCLFDETATHYVRPARGARHLIQLLNLLADAGNKAPSSGQAGLRPLLRLGYGLAQELYPGQLRPDINYLPWWLPWLWPQPAYNVRRPGGADRFDRWLFMVMLILWGTGLGFLLLAVIMHGAQWFVQLFAALLVTGVMAGGFFLSLSLLRGYILFHPTRRRQFHWRKRLAALLSVRYGLAPGGLALLLEDDTAMIDYLQRFLAEHHVPYPLPMYDRRGRYLFAAPEKINVLAAALVRAVGKGHDNEMFVLLVDLLELEDHMGPLVRAIKVARARHHRVMVVCPWPPGVPPPTRDNKEPSGRTRRQRQLWGEGSTRLKRILERTTTSRFHRAFHHLRRTLARLEVPVLCAQEPEPARLILERLDQLRLLGRTR